ncbi:MULTISPECIES: hypothetical protein [Kitasatospora]|uniref:hypothetical protein n=1 Tax=Kitasatospora TaxID=2063 RepID=UPI000CC170C5|nr:hypothetical protein [Kitasatospora sp. GP30]MDH6143986.1 hypothetical protein [Kitasatospora sp. GP30]
MSQQSLTALLAASPADTGFHPGLLAFVYYGLIIAAIIATPIYVVRLVRDRRKRR